MRAHVIRIVVVLVLGVGLAAPVPVKTAVGQQASGGEAVPGTPPLYDIHEIAPVAGYRLSEGLAITSGGMAAGRSLKYGSSVAFTWTLDGGIVPLPSYPGYSAHSIPYGVNGSGIVVGIGTSEPSGDNRIPLIWRNGIVDRLPIPLPDYYSVGQANGINAAGIAVGSVGMGTGEVAVLFDGDRTRIICGPIGRRVYFSAAYAINDHDVIVGQGVDLDDASRTVPFVYDASTLLPSVRELTPLKGDNGGIAFAISNSGYIAGFSSLFNGSPTSVVWDPQGRVWEIPTPPGSTGGVMRGVNDAGWAVGYASSATSVPFLWDGTATYRLQDLIPAGSGWRLEGDTAGAAMAITNENVVVGTGNYRGRDRAFVAIPRADAPVRAIVIDVKPGSRDNPLNLRARGVLPVTIPGSAAFRVASIAPATIRLNGVAPISWLYRDTDANGILDLELKFSIEGLAAALAGSVHGDPVTLVLTAILRNRIESVRGEDVVTIVGR